MPILDCTSQAARLIMQEAHEQDHGGVDRTLWRSRSTAWIIRGRRTAATIQRNCFTCRRRRKKLEQQIMAPLPEIRMKPAPVFSSTAIDLFGPITIKDTVKGRARRKAWGVLFCCMATTAVHIEVTEDYSCDSFLLCLKRFVNLRGTPTWIQSDPNTRF